MGEVEKIKQVARAITVVTIPEYSDDDLWEEHWAWYLRGRGDGGSADNSTQARAERQARAAIEAMRPATVGMSEAGDDALRKSGNFPADDAWGAMIDAVLR